MSTVRNVKTWVNRMRATNMTWKDIASELYQDAPTEKAAYGRLKRLRDSDYAEGRLISRKATSAFELSESTMAPIPWWGGVEGAVRDDRISWEELKYLVKNGRSDTVKRANEMIVDIMDREGITDMSAIPDEQTFNRPMISKTVKGQRLSWRFGRGKSDVQISRVKQQLRDKGISWSKAYADFAGYS